MPIIKKFRYERNWTPLPNAIFEDDSISYKARGILAYLLCKPPDWQVIIENLINRSSRDGKHAVYSGIRELIDAGYIRKERERDSSGRLGALVYVVYESPEPVQFIQQKIIMEDRDSIFIITKSGESFEVTADMISGYQKIYPNIDVRQQIRQLAEWCQVNPKRRKINIKRFLTNNLSRKNEQATTLFRSSGRFPGTRITPTGGGFD